MMVVAPLKLCHNNKKKGAMVPFFYPYFQDS